VRRANENHSGHSRRRTRAGQGVRGGKIPLCRGGNLCPAEARIVAAHSCSQGRKFLHFLPRRSQRSYHAGARTQNRGRKRVSIWLLDVNILVARFWETHVFHWKVRAWMESHEQEAGQPAPSRRLEWSEPSPIRRFPLTLRGLPKPSIGLERACGRIPTTISGPTAYPSQMLVLKACLG